MKTVPITVLILPDVILPVTVHDAVGQSDYIMDADNDLNIHASFYPYYEFTRMVTTYGDAVDDFLPLGVVLHDWKPILPRIQSLQATDVFVYNGLGVEGYMERLTELDDLEHILPGGEPRQYAHDYSSDDDHDAHTHDRDDHRHGDVDTHVWLDPVLAVQQVLNIRDGLIDTSPTNAEEYYSNAALFIAQLEEMHHNYNILSICQHNSIMTTHLVFGYLVERYGIQVQSLSGISPEEASTDITELVNYMHGIMYVLAEEFVDTRAVTILAEETGSQIPSLSPIDTIISDRLESGVPYLDIMRENLAVLEVALSCS